MQDRVDRIWNILDSKKAEEIESIDLRGSGYFVDCVVIATALNEKHSLALLDELKQELKSDGEQFLNIEISEDWIVADLGDILIHLMNKSTREKFNLESFLEGIKKSK